MTPFMWHSGWSHSRGTDTRSEVKGKVRVWLQEGKHREILIWVEYNGIVSSSGWWLCDSQDSTDSKFFIFAN